MSFWAYMIQCADRLFYVGHTEDLDVRLAQHQAGTFKGYTSAKRPVHLVWSAEFPTRYEALTTERRVKGWRREKKLALIRGDWAAISMLSRTAREEGKASTSSARTAWGEALGPLFLHPHPAQLPSEPFSLEAQVRVSSDRLKARFRLSGPLDLLRIPPRTRSTRRDLLWQHACFEVFVTDTDGTYLEYNLSSSTEWAAYRFTAYREGMANLDIAPPAITLSQTNQTLQLTANLPLPPGFQPTRIGLSAILEDISGDKTHWALAHPSGGAPDFHLPDCFALKVPPAG